MQWLRLVLQESLRNLAMRYRAFRQHGVFVPAGAVLSRAECMTIGSAFAISPDCQVLCQDPENGSELAIGNHVSLNYGVHINADMGGKINIGDNVIMGPNCTLRAADHRFSRVDIPIRHQGHAPGTIIVEDDVWLGANVTVLRNVTIGRSSVIGAGSVVTRDIPPGSVAVGNPAKVIRERGNDVPQGAEQ